MKWQLLLFVSVLVISINSAAQDKDDSMLTDYVNYLATHTNISYDSIHRLEQDSAFKIVSSFFKLSCEKKGVTLTDNTVYPMDSATIAFISRRRLKTSSRK